MKFVCSKTALSRIVNIVQKAISAKTSYPILDCIKIDAQSDSHISFTANSIDVCIEYNGEITVYEEGTVALPSRIFCDIVRKLPDGEITITVDESNFVADIDCGNSKFNIQGTDASEFPSIPIVEEIYKTSVSQKMMRDVIKKVFPFVAQAETRKPILTGALFEFKDDFLTVVGTDSHRLAVIKMPVKTEYENVKFVVPGITLQKVNQIIEENEESSVDIIVSDKHILFDFGDYQLYSRLLEGDFLKYDVILAVNNAIKLKADKNSLINSLERANLIINYEILSRTNNKIPVRINISYNKVEISCKTTKGYVNDFINVENDGGELLIGLNCRFMLDALNACDDDTVIMEFSAPTSGCFIRPEDGSDKYTYMVLPVRLK